MVKKGNYILLIQIKEGLFLRILSELKFQSACNSLVVSSVQVGPEILLPKDTLSAAVSPLLNSSNPSPFAVFPLSYVIGLENLPTQKQFEIKYAVYKSILFLTGVYKEAFSEAILKEEFFEELSEEDKEDWKEKHGEDVMSYFNHSLITKIGRPALKMLRLVSYCLFAFYWCCEVSLLEVIYHKHLL